MIEVVIADHQEIFRIGIAEVLAAAGEVRIVGQAQSAAQVLSTLKKAKPHVLILSTSLLPALPKIERMLERHQTALLLLAEENDQNAYFQWLRAHGIVDRSMDEPTLVDAVRRVARGELLCRFAHPTREKTRPKLPEGRRRNCRFDRLRSGVPASRDARYPAANQRQNQP
jgi:DNA-binding NarL/FixJ family response regulator